MIRLDNGQDIDDKEDYDPEIDGAPPHDNDVFCLDLSTADIEFIRASQIKGGSPESVSSTLCCDSLDNAPIKIWDTFSCVLGDILHATDRAKVPTKYEYNKGYFVALREAFLEWDANVLKELKLQMIAKGMPEKEIDDAMYFTSLSFTQCVAQLSSSLAKLE